MRPPETAPNRTRDVVRGVSLGVMQAMAGGPTGRRAGTVEHREENQHSARPRIQGQRAMRDRAMVPDRGAQSADEYQRYRAEQHAPSGNRIQHQSNRGGNMNEANPEQDRKVPPRGDVPPWHLPRRGLGGF